MEEVRTPVEAVEASLASPDAPPELPVPQIKIRPPGPFSPLAIGELWQYRDLFTALAIRDVKLRYKQTALGVIWVVLQPLMGAVIFTLVFHVVAGMQSGNVPYLLFAYVGMLGWQAFNSTLSKASACVVQNSQLVSKIFFPRLILPLSTLLSSLIDYAVGLVFLVGLMIYYGFYPGPGVLLMPVLLGLLLLLAIGLGLYTSALMVEYRDLQYAIPVLLQFLMYASPVAYEVAKVPEKYRAIYFLNPVTGLLEAFRWSLLNKCDVSISYIWYAVGATVAVFIFGAVAFKRMERRFADVI